jgi:hypothetical protein
MKENVLDVLMYLFETYATTRTGSRFTRKRLMAPVFTTTLSRSASIPPAAATFPISSRSASCRHNNEKFS